MIPKTCQNNKIILILRQHIPTALLNTTNVSVTTIKDKPTRFGYKRIDIIRPELQDTKGGLIMTTIILEISTITIKMCKYCRNIQEYERCRMPVECNLKV
jgi:hypothetical protein